MRGPAVRERLTELLRPLREAEVDTIVLGCTHYPFLAAEVQASVGPGVQLVESGRAIARQTERVLAEQRLLEPQGEGSVRLQTTGDPHPVSEVASRLWGSPVAAEGVAIRHYREVAQARSIGGLPSAGNSR